ncbi:50S ribosomal protein L19e [Candidatus Woesearchaeota archaeon]|nr:50S ribosomal protein L19e [Candidatus Woesearchaeota archaeon]
MKLNVQKRLAGDILKCSPKRVWFAPDRLADIKEAITKADIRALISEGVVAKEQAKGVSRARANHRAIQRSKGLQRGPGKKKGKKTALVPRKEAWMAKIRAQRVLLTQLRVGKIVSEETYKQLYRKAKGGFFRNRRHIKVYIKEQNLLQQKEK